MDKKKALQIIAENRESYNIIALDFDVTRKAPWPEFQELGRHIKKGDKILDVGCGNGRLYKYINDELRITNNYIGIDQSEELIEIAKKSLPTSLFEREGSSKDVPPFGKGGRGGIFMVADIFNLPFGENEFDVAAGIAFLHHIPSQELRLQVLKEIYRVLAPGGILFLSNWNLWRWEIISHNVKRNKMNPLHFFFPHNGMDAGDFWIPFRASNGGKPIPRYYHHFTKRDLMALAKQAGFKIIFYKKDRNIVAVLQK